MLTEYREHATRSKSVIDPMLGFVKASGEVKEFLSPTSAKAHFLDRPGWCEKSRETSSRSGKIPASIDELR